VRSLRSFLSHLDASIIRAHEQAMICAAMIAVLYRLLGESEINRRRWIDTCVKECDAWESVLEGSYQFGEPGGQVVPDDARAKIAHVRASIEVLRSFAIA
jgi:hypothetical protein